MPQPEIPWTITQANSAQALTRASPFNRTPGLRVFGAPLSIVIDPLQGDSGRSSYYGIAELFCKEHASLCRDGTLGEPGLFRSGGGRVPLSGPFGKDFVPKQRTSISVFRMGRRRQGPNGRPSKYGLRECRARLVGHGVGYPLKRLPFRAASSIMKGNPWGRKSWESSEKA